MGTKMIFSSRSCLLLWLASILFFVGGGTVWAGSASAENTFVTVGVTANNSVSIVDVGNDFYIGTEDSSVEVTIAPKEDFELVEPDPDTTTFPITINAGDSEDYAVAGIAPETMDGAGTIYIIKVDSIDGYVYGESGREIPDMEELADPANVVASGCTETVDLKTIRPYVVRVKFVDDWIWPFPGNEQQIADGGDPEFDATVPESFPVCYEKDTDLQVEVDLAGDVDDDSSNDLKKKTQIKVTGKLYYDGAENGDLDEDSIDDDTEDWSTADYSTVDMHTGANFPDEVTEFEDFKMRWIFKVKDSSGNWVVAYEDTAGCGYSHETEHKETAGGKTYGLYLIYDDHEFSDDADFVKLTLDYACRWVDGENSENAILQAILDNGFVAEYSYTIGGNCWYLAKEFDHASKALGISSELHKWEVSSSSSIGEMHKMYPHPFEPVGTNTWNDWHAATSYGLDPSVGWGYHEFVEANGAIYDPSAGVKNSGSWGDYEDSCFEKYSKVTVIAPPAFQWDNNQPGQSSGCENSAIHTDNDAWPTAPYDDFIGPPYGHY